MNSEDNQSRSALSGVLFERGDGSFGVVDRGGDWRGVRDEHIVALTVLRVRQFGGVGSRLSLCLLDAALDVLERDA